MKKRPNFLILLTDQQRWDTIAQTGFPHVETPNLDRLARQSTWFRNAHSPNPICVPARHSLLTGARSSKHGFYSNAGSRMADEHLPTYPRVLAENGYYCSAIGKMHFKPVRCDHGYHELQLMEEIPKVEEDEYAESLAADGLGPDRIQSLHGVRPLIYHDAQATPLPEAKHGTFWVADRALDFIDRNGSEPFMLTCGFIHPHPPLAIPAEWSGRYAGKTFPESVEAVRHTPYPAVPDPLHGESASAEDTRAFKEAYFTAITMIDEAVGKILDGLEQAGLLENTCILFTSDHGEMLGDLGLYQKGCPYEGSVRVPMLWRFKDHFKEGETDHRFVDLMDVFPTLLDIAGIPLPDPGADAKYALDGESLLAEAPRRDRSVQFVENGARGARWVSLRDDRYKYIHFFSGGIEQFFDLEADPGETNNLIGSDDLPLAALNRLRSKCLEIEARSGEPGTVANGAFVCDPKIWIREVQNARLAAFSNLQFPEITSGAKETDAAFHLQEIETALGDRVSEVVGRLPSVYIEDWKQQFALRYGSADVLEAWIEAMRTRR